VIRNGRKAPKVEEKRKDALEMDQEAQKENEKKAEETHR
jgi:hypothetical protein